MKRLEPLSNSILEQDTPLVESKIRNNEVVFRTYIGKGGDAIIDGVTYWGSTVKVTNDSASK
jgi:hypothetical protein